MARSSELDPQMLMQVRRAHPYEKPALKRSVGKVALYHETARWERVIKRGFDIVFASVALGLFGLIFPFLALAIRLDSRGPIFYRQTRVGINRRSLERRARQMAEAGALAEPDRRGRARRQILAEGHCFDIIKLRSMYIGSESDGIRWASRGDSRITRVGSFLRHTRFDEVPQFWNVLRGEMSVVGPRPERPPFTTFLAREVPGFLERLRFKPGITGLAQVKNGYDEDLDSVDRKVELDLDYINRFNLALDAKILFRTVWVVLSGQGAN